MYVGVYTYVTLSFDVWLILVWYDVEKWMHAWSKECSKGFSDLKWWTWKVGFGSMYIYICVWAVYIYIYIYMYVHAHKNCLLVHKYVRCRFLYLWWNDLKMIVFLNECYGI